MKKEQLIRYYSGPRSVKFWDLINKQIKEKRTKVDLYLLGCCLQDMEHRILQLIEENLPKRKSKLKAKAANGKN